jgi:hypothetical protein
MQSPCTEQRSKTLDVHDPTASRAAFILRRHLQSSGVEVPLSVAQESVARFRGYGDWNTLTSHI